MENGLGLLADAGVEIGFVCKDFGWGTTGGRTVLDGFTLDAIDVIDFLKAALATEIFLAATRDAAGIDAYVGLPDERGAQL